MFDLLPPFFKMAFARSFIALVALLCFAVVAVVRAQAASGDVTKLQIGVKVRREREPVCEIFFLAPWK